MNRATIERRLRGVEQHIARGENTFTRHDRIIAEFQTWQAGRHQSQELFVILEETQHQHIVTRARIQRKISSMRNSQRQLDS
jgi:macrodomain Ter protein organizer (MatP/YcbG family)